MTTLPNGRSSRWRNFTSGNSKRWAANLLPTLSSVGPWPTPWWAPSSSHQFTDGCCVSPLPWPWPLSWEFRPQTGSAPRRHSMKSCRSLLPTVRTYVALSKSTSPCGGMMSVASWIQTDTLFQKWLSTTRRLRLRKHTLDLTLLSIEMIANNNTPHYLN